jgi:hypothetical protein
MGITRNLRPFPHMNRELYNFYFICHFCYSHCHQKYTSKALRHIEYDKTNLRRSSFSFVCASFQVWLVKKDVKKRNRKGNRTAGGHTRVKNQPMMCLVHSLSRYLRSVKCTFVVPWLWTAVVPKTYIDGTCTSVWGILGARLTKPLEQSRKLDFFISQIFLPDNFTGWK